MTQALLEINRLTVEFPTANGALTPVTDVSFHIGRGETVCLVGESGSGKTITSKAIMRLIDFERGRIAKGSVKLDGSELTNIPQRILQSVRGKKVAMVFQEPMSAFDPVFTIGHQLVETIRRHDKKSGNTAKIHAIELLGRVGLPEPELRYHQYPNELSGGMLQRAMIAMALACGPELLIADEPTTALDVTIQAQILSLLMDLQAEYGMSILLITHDLGIAAEMADRMIVMYAGRIVEQAAADRLFAEPRHPYTAALLRSITTLDSDRNAPLHTIEGTPPNVSEFPSGCRFHPRCPLATSKCKAEAPALIGDGAHDVACWHSDLLVKSEEQKRSESKPGSRLEMQEEPRAQKNDSSERKIVLFDVEGLTKHYPIKGSFGRTKAVIHAVDDVSFQIYEGETFGLVGESGSGKSTLGRVLIQLEKATAGHIRFRGKLLTDSDGGEQRQIRRDMQMIFQDPYGSVNPRWTVGETIAEPLDVHHVAAKGERRARVEELLSMVGLNPAWADRYPHEFSGGQRQRIGIARAIALNPRFVLADEAVSALDVSVQAQIINLMQELQNRLGLTYLFIAHGLNIVRHVSTRIGVMYLGNLVEIATAEELFSHPAHPYTALLIASIPWADPARKRFFTPIQGEIPSPAAPPAGCRFHTRCPAATARCREEAPVMKTVSTGHSVACHYPI
ncbi:ABC transporter ATP-binding protein [Brevibacillus choshinensis]|uniref:ABC transporter ATP-binding protein n=1 Tax=Brevibacillus choshinensis TaxID=54911 RepID=A0ABX7FJJ0_BRECH|nr:ABC transporter ATP-binding protein [Brevibacillus choshinensis]QRG65170.1 ABC transporter ATP-binding protein [Brevibacillus choshinensis]